MDTFWFGAIFVLSSAAVVGFACAKINKIARDVNDCVQRIGDIQRHVEALEKQIIGLADRYTEPPAQ